ncbi:glycosyltransferase family A protein [Algibacter aquimarinus]|uniref:Glycosyltransferase 2-like domain-containing protein n=1 Tax=Algibacter aquimarinus TaxID=1136748 RepID=A0ABP9HQW8_9FLAO
MTTDLVSIIVPCYNQSQYLDECLLSVLNQTFADWECIIVNDGSTDSTQKTAKKWLEKDERFKYAFQESSGLSSARNYGIKQANGEFVLPLDADDKIGVDYLQLAIKEFKKNTKLKVVYCKAEKFGEVNEIWKLPEFSLHNLSLKNMIFCTAMFRKIDCQAIGGFDVNMLYGWEDWEFWISMLKKGGEVKRINSIQFYYRIKSDSMLMAMNPEKVKYTEEYLSIKHADFFVKQLGSFKSLLRATDEVKNDYEEKLNSEKFIVNSFFKKFLGITIFRNK